MHSFSGLFPLVEWICWLNGQRKKAPTPEAEKMISHREEIFSHPKGTWSVTE
ncbi:hypothetical protein GLYMA_15G209900v4 [Glycine max]|uniref:NADH dehydrogenase [ubiquinone] 1 alpha subcomplex subunit 12 n=2 Tax=Glycine subgen. Soja TaxID=1462606 RepID=K7MCQ3_SOYBN|nr:hypothetical protein JHK87_043041 [Glycine soja]KAG4949888.1 hypothetical protein JHK86_043127 [Glycine max]KAG4957384.1 hypothetical protein JHK85_043764 [Glycine max]KAG5117204.1 hypothetical protein JHK84_043317 [Glycine max]KAH1148169.1 hypothetical protein GYH30_043030 [Glycine max]